MSEVITTAVEPVIPASSAAVWRRVGLFLSGQSLSLIGDQVFFIAVVWVAAQVGGNAGVTWVTLAESVPRGLSLIFGGVICDAFGPRTVLLRTTGCGSWCWASPPCSRSAPRRCGCWSRWPRWKARCWASARPPTAPCCPE